VNVLEAALRRVADDLDKSGRLWALVGGFAVSARVEPRFTRDVDMQSWWMAILRPTIATSARHWAIS